MSATELLPGAEALSLLVPVAVGAGATEVTPAPVPPELLRAPELPPDAPQGLQGGPEEVPHQEPDLGRGEEQEGDVQSAQEALRAAGTCKDCPAWGAAVGQPRVPVLPLPWALSPPGSPGPRPREPDAGWELPWDSFG